MSYIRLHIALVPITITITISYLLAINYIIQMSKNAIMAIIITTIYPRPGVTHSHTILNKSLKSSITI